MFQGGRLIALLVRLPSRAGISGTKLPTVDNDRVVRTLMAAVVGVIIGTMASFFGLAYMVSDFAHSAPDSIEPLRIGVAIATPFVTGALFGWTAYRLSPRRR
jgi:hypothetical protein